MRRKFAEVDKSGEVVEVHIIETKGNKGAEAKEPKTQPNKKDSNNSIKLAKNVRKGDKWHERRGVFLRKLERNN